MIHDVIFKELVRGEIVPESKDTYLEVIELLIGPDDIPVPFFPTTAIHAAAAAEFALG